MKKLFTLVALLAVFMGAKAEWVQDYKIDYSQKTGFPFFVMGYVPEWVDGIMTDYGALYKYVEVKDDATETSDVIVKNQDGKEYYKIGPLAEPAWHQYFIADGIPTELDGAYTVKAMVKASEAVTINVNMGWGWGEGQSKGAQVSIGTDWAEVEWEYTGIGGTSCNLVAQPGSATATIEWKYLIVGHNAKPAAPTVWQEWMTSDGKSVVVEKEVKDIANWTGGAEFGNWPDWALETTDGINANWRGTRTGEICAWALTMGKNFDDQCPTDISADSYRARPYPAPIELEEGTTNHVFAAHVDQIGVIDAPEPDANSVAWSNQFWIQSPQGWKAGTAIKIQFRYKAQHACKAGTQIHKQRPSDYLHWQAIGDVSFTEEWQTYSNTLTFNESQGGGWSLAFNLCSDEANGRTPNVFYFDDLSWQTMVLDEGFFVASSNSATGIEYDFATATEFVADPEEEGVIFAVVGEEGKKDTWVSEVMISTVRGDDAAFKGATIKPTDAITSGGWIGFTEATLAKIKLPGAGVWKIQLDPNTKEICFTQIEGEAAKEPVDIVTNATEFVVNAVERDWRGKDNDGNPIEEQVGTGQPWDNQFWIAANRDLEKGEVTVLKFKYKSSIDAKTSTQIHKMGTDNKPCTYMHWGAIGDVNFAAGDWVEFEKEYTVPAEADGMRSIVFNMAEIKSACDYYIKDVQWFVKYEVEGKTMENLIDAEGTKNFWVKILTVDEGRPYQYGTDPTGIQNVTAKSVKASDVIYNIAGQRVNKDFKGLVIMDGKKIVK